MNACEKPLNWRGKCAVQQFSITLWRWLMAFFMWIATQFPSFLKFYLNNFRHSTQFSSLIILSKLLSTQLNVPYCFFVSACILDCFGWPSGPSETIYPKNSFPTTHNVDTLETSKPKKLFDNYSKIVVISLLCFGTVFFQATPKLWSISENLSKYI